MNVLQKDFTLQTQGRGMINITQSVSNIVNQSMIKQGICHVFIHHTSASLLINENADMTVQQDLETFMAKLVKDGDKTFHHLAEGPDDMPSHIRSVLTQTTLSIPVRERELYLGRWQGLYLWEHRFDTYERKLTVTILGN